MLLSVSSMGYLVILIDENWAFLLIKNNKTYSEVFLSLNLKLCIITASWKSLVFISGLDESA